MKSKLNPCTKSSTLSFPRLMRSKVSGAIHLVTAMDKQEFTATVVNGTTNWGKGIGTTFTSSTVESLEDYDGTVTLSND